SPRRRRAAADRAHDPPDADPGSRREADDLCRGDLEHVRLSRRARRRPRVGRARVYGPVHRRSRRAAGARRRRSRDARLPALLAGRSGVRVMPEWDVYEGLDTRLGAPVPDFTVPDHYTRKKVRSMGRVALLATRATELALADAGLLGSSIVTDGTTGIAYGSTSGSPPAMEIYAEAFYMKHSLKGIAGTDYLQFMSHTCAANLAQF